MEPLPLRECECDPALELRDDDEMVGRCRLGPLKRFFLRFANCTPPANGLGEPGARLPTGMPSLYICSGGGGGAGEPRTRRMLEGNACEVGVAGKTLTEWCGEFVRPSGVLDVEMDPVELVDEAFECVWWW